MSFQNPNHSIPMPEHFDGGLTRGFNILHNAQATKHSQFLYANRMGRHIVTVLCNRRRDYFTTPWEMKEYVSSNIQDFTTMKILLKQYKVSREFWQEAILAAWKRAGLVT